jgi:flagellar secretion chaperone FliS
MYRQFAQQYQKVAVESAPPDQILDQLYNRLLLDLGEVSEAISQRDILRRAKAADHALRIVEALRICLDHAVAPELCARLDSMYEYVIHQLHQACFTQSPKPLVEAERRIVELQDTFRQAASLR